MNIYHEALLVRLASLLAIFAVIGPVLWLLLSSGWRFMQGLARHPRQQQRRLS
jgi:hypothetical protein